MSNWGLYCYRFHKNFSELFLVVLSALSWLDIDKDELDVVVLVLLPPVVPVLDVAVVVVLLVWSWLLGSFFTTLTWLLEVAEAEAVSVASALCQLVNSWETKWRSLSRYWLYNSTSLWPAPWKKNRNCEKIVKIKGNIPKIQNSEMNHHLTDGHVFVWPKMVKILLHFRYIKEAVALV